MINGVIFDMDGLMFDTERMWATFWKPALAALDLEYKEGLAEAERGTAGETSRNIVRQFYGEDCDANAIIDSLHRVADEEFQKPVPKKPGLDELLACINVLVDGRFVKELKDISLQFRGSRNQRVIDMDRTREAGEITIWEKLRK